MKTAHKILNWVREQGINRYDLKTLIIRSNAKGETIAALFATNQQLKITNMPLLEQGMRGFYIYYSSRKSPASVIHGQIAGQGYDFLNEELLGVDLSYGLNSFFQINIPVFEKTLKKISTLLPKDAKVLDFYSGVGSISIPLSKQIHSASLIDINSEAINFAQKNIELHQLKNFTAKAVEAERALEYITDDKVLIVDPPRAGLHGDVIKRIKEVKPPLIVYLSCNASTQARDIKEIIDDYEIIDAVLYDYFPRTPHFESLIVLKRFV